MHVENITRNAMSLDRNGQSMLIQVYEKEIDRLNNIINKLEKWCNECIDYQIIARENGDTTISDTFFEIVLDKLKELKEDKC